MISDLHTTLFNKLPNEHHYIDIIQLTQFIQFIHTKQISISRNCSAVQC